jgi:putative colanic acid biosynthesis acetyltransferase WcaF
MAINRDTHRGPAFPVSNRVRRAVWNAIWLMLFRPSPRPCHGWRRCLLRCFGAKVGRGVHVYPAARIWAPWNLVLEDECGVADGVTLYSQGLIRLGRRCVVSQGSHLCTGSHDYERPGFPLFTKPIVVGAHAWIAAECFVHPGVTVGEGAVIGARAVVATDMPAWTVCAGHPCKPLKARNYVVPKSSAVRLV